MINFRILLLAIIILLPITQALSESGNYPSKVEVSLRKSGSNRAELEKAILYYVEKGDSQMLQAVYFLIENMDIHYGETYTIKDGTGTRLPFSEFEYPDINHTSDKRSSEFSGFSIFRLADYKGKFINRQY